MKHPIASSYPNVGGFTLFEVLISVLVLSIGLLGVASMQILSLRSNSGAYLRSEATLRAYDIIDRIRANSTAAAGYATAMAAAPSAPAVNCASAACSTTNLAAYDLAQWKCALGKWNANAVCAAYPQGKLPQGDGSVAINGNIYTVIVQWFDQTTNNNQQIQVSVAL